jgi:predicted nuclease with TOPRIM domain
MEQENKELKEKVKSLEQENIQLKERLSKYTNPQRNKKYYEENKDKIIAHNIEYAKNKKK